MILRFPERGSIDVPRDLWGIISTDTHFWNLVERGIFRVEQKTSGTIRLSGGCYVGRAIIANKVIIELEEKVPGSLATLLGHSTSIDFRIERAPSPSSSLGPLIGLLANQFTESVNRYASRGREFIYRRHTQVGSLIGGKLHLTGTTRLRARGLRHLAQFEKNTVAFDTPVNCVILAALRELETILKLIPIDVVTLSKSRSMAILFSDCRNQQVLYGLRSSLVQLAAEQARSNDPLIRDLMSLAGVILSHESFEHKAQLDRETPRSWFLNLETLFETGVRNIFKKTLGSSAIVQNGRSSPSPIFPNNGSAYKANPDIVIRTSENPLIVGDAKYKVQQQAPSPDDLYQLLVHASAYGAKTSFLVYPHNAFQYYDLGTATTGSRVYIFYVNLSNLEESIKSVLSTIEMQNAFVN